MPILHIPRHITRTISTRPTSDLNLRRIDSILTNITWSPGGSKAPSRPGREARLAVVKCSDVDRQTDGDLRKRMTRGEARSLQEQAGILAHQTSFASRQGNGHPFFVYFRAFTFCPYSLLPAYRVAAAGRGTRLFMVAAPRWLRWSLRWL